MTKHKTSDPEIIIDPTKYSKVYNRKNNEWTMVGYQCRDCYSKIAAIGRVASHTKLCRGIVKTVYRNKL
jgi:hypothetical protein